MLLKKFDQAQKEYEKIIEISPASYESKLASIGISKILTYKLNQMGLNPDFVRSSSGTDNQARDYKKFEPNYISNAINGGKVTRWNIEKMPIKLYIERPTNLTGYKDSYFADVKRAIDSWVNEVGTDLISYKLVNNPNEADILVYFVSEISKMSGNVRVSGLATPFIRGHILQRYEIKFLPHEQMHSTALHEFGHALGIQGHSSEKTDIMYAAINDVNSLSKRDINTMSFLYNLDPAISNFDEGFVPVESEKNEKLLGSEESLLKEDLDEAIEYTKKFPDNALSWVHLGKAYYELEQYEKAEENFKKALKIDPNFINAMEQLAFTYEKMGNLQKTEYYFKALVNKEPDNINFSYNLASYFIKQNQYQEAKQVIQSLINVNPQAKNDENIKNLTEIIY